MTEIRLTKFAKILIAIAIIGLAWLLIDAVTPDECKVDPAEMSAACKSLVFS